MITKRSLQFVVIVVAAAGCSSKLERSAKPTLLDRSEFVADQATDAEPVAVVYASPGPAVDPGAADADAPPTGDDAPLALGASSPDVTAEAEDDESMVVDPRDELSIEPLSVDSLVGQINGRPLFADEFFRPIEAQLAAAGREMAPREFIAEADKTITSHLQQVVLNDLFLAEAEASLSVEQQQGLIHWLREQTQETVRLWGGASRSSAEQRLREEEGLTLEEYMKIRRDQALIADLIRRKIDARIVVSWRDIEREYERRQREFNPNARVELSRLRLRTESEADAIADVKARLAGRQSFAEIAEAFGRDDGGKWDTFPMGPGGIADIEVSDAIKQHLSGLQVGQTTAAFQLGSYTWWVHVDATMQPEVQDLFDPQVQRQLAGEIRALRFKEEEQKYIRSLLEQGIVDNLDEMKLRLLSIAVKRYGMV